MFGIVYEKLEMMALDWLRHNGDTEGLEDEVKYIKQLCDQILKEKKKGIANADFIDERLAMILATTEKAYGCLHPEPEAPI
jgi:predicted RNase H-like nuclease